MDGIPDSANGWLWWVFSVVFVSFVVNILSTYAKPILDNLGMKYSENRRKKIIEAKEKLENAVESFNTPEGINFLKIDLLGIYIQMSIVLLLTIITANVSYNLIDFIMHYGGMYTLTHPTAEILLFIRETISVLVSIVGLIIWLFLLNKTRLVDAILKSIYAKDTKLNSLANMSL